MLLHVASVLDANEIAHLLPGQTFSEGRALGPRLAGSRLHLAPVQAPTEFSQELGEGRDLGSIGQELAGIHGIYPV